MSDYFDRVEEHLLDAVERHAARRARPAGALRERLGGLRGRLPRSRRPGLLALVAVLVLSGSAAGAALLSGQRSRPLSGVVPPYAVKADTISVAGSHYEVVVSPSLRAGSIGLCTYVFFRHVHGISGKGYGAGSCADAPAVGHPLFGAEGEQGGLWHVLTGPQVAAVRVPGGPTILTRREAGLPDGYRAAVFQLKNKKFRPSHPPQLIALDASGEAIPGKAFGEGPQDDQTRSWSNPLDPAKGVCSISARTSSGLQVKRGAVVTRLVADPGIVGDTFLSCEEVELSVHGLPIVAAELLDAKHPRSRPAALPDTRPVRGDPGVYTGFGGSRLNLLDFVARREGNAWLVVSGTPGPGTSARSEAHALQALQALSTGPIDLRSPTRTPRVQADAECRIGVRPLAGLQEVSQTTFLVHGHPGQGAKIGGPTPELRSCESADFYLHDWPISATVLYPTDGSRTPKQFAKRKPVPGHANLFTIKYFEGAERHNIVEHVGRVWLEIEGGSGIRQQRALLRQLDVSVAASRAVQSTFSTTLAGAGLSMLP